MRLSRYGIVLESLTSDHLEMVRLWRNQEFVRCNMQFKELWTVPNIISYTRVPLAILTIYYLGTHLQYVFLGIAVFTDWLDGFAARKMGLVSKLGGIIDPLFDKIFVLILFPFLFISLNLPIAFILLFFARDIFSSLGFIAFHKDADKIEFKARPIGKAVTVLQFTTLLLMLHGDLTYITLSMWTLFIVSIASMIDYIIYFKKVTHS